MKLINTLLALLVALKGIEANYASDCDPLKNTCSPDPALGKSIYLDFTKETSYFSKYLSGTNIEFTSNGLREYYAKKGDNPSLRSNFYIMYGKIEIKCKIAKGTGIISNMFLQSDTGDEIDFEWISGNKQKVDTNYFGKGVTGSYDRGKTVELGADVTSDYHTYTLEWTDSAITWTFDGKNIRTLKKSEVSNDGKHDFPVSPMRVFIGLWAGGDSDVAGTVEWAGGKTTTDGAPFELLTKYIKISDYSTGSSYSYSDKTGNSISSNGGKVNGRSNAALVDSVSDPSGFTAASVSTTATSTTTSSSSSSTSSTTGTDTTTTTSESTSSTTSGTLAAVGATVSESSTTSTWSSSSLYNSTSYSDSTAAAATEAATGATSTSLTYSSATSAAASDVAAQGVTSTTPAAATAEAVAATSSDELVTSETTYLSTYTASHITVISGHTTGVSYGVSTHDGTAETYTTQLVPLTSTHTNFHYVTVKRKHSSSAASNYSSLNDTLFFGAASKSVTRDFTVVLGALVSLLAVAISL